MKKLLLLIAFPALLFACNEKTKKEFHAEHDDFKKEIKELQIKLKATEAQLLNVQAELSKYKAADSLNTSGSK